ncbi:MAG: ribonuclease HII [Nesterenkonia sp.]|nr:ribonuclease HII [Nesterenkonia sp.]
MPIDATLIPELRLAARTGARFVAGVDEVGRGALAGPVSVGVTVLDLEHPEIADADDGVWPVLAGVRDSKQLTARARTRWAPTVRESAAAYSVQHRAAHRIDEIGLSGALREAGLAGLHDSESRLGRRIDAVIVDGSHDWLTGGRSARVTAMAKADTLALSVAAASVLAKVERDQLMAEFAATHPDYGWESNRGYGSAAHREALARHGPTSLHRLSWNLITQASESSTESL